MTKEAVSVSVVDEAVEETEDAVDEGEIHLVVVGVEDSETETVLVIETAVVANQVRFLCFGEIMLLSIYALGLEGLRRS